MTADLAVLVASLAGPATRPGDGCKSTNAPPSSPIAAALAALDTAGDLDSRRRLVAALRRAVQTAAEAGRADELTAAGPVLASLAADMKEDPPTRRLALEGLAAAVAVTETVPPDTVASVALTCLAAGAPARLRAAALRALAAAAPTAGATTTQPAARAALHSFTADPDPGVREAALSGMVDSGLRLPKNAHAVAVGALGDDGSAAVRLAGLRLLGVAAAAAGATAPVPDAPAPCITPIAARRAAEADDAAAAAADAAFAAAAGALADPAAPVRAAALGVLGSLARASPAVKAGALSKKSTARTMEGQSMDDAALVVGPGADSGGGLGLVVAEKADDQGEPPAPHVAPAAAAAAAAAAATSADDWASYAGAFVHGLEDDAAAVRTAALDAMAALGTADPGWAGKAADFAADCAGDESPGVRAAALRCVAALVEAARPATALDPFLPAVTAGLADTSPPVRSAACGLLGRCARRLASTAAVGSAVDALLDAALADARLRGGRLDDGGKAAQGGPADHAQPATPLAALAALGAAIPARLAPLVPDIMATRSGFLQVEPSVDTPAYAARLVAVLAALCGDGRGGRCGLPALGALLPAHALGGAAVVLAGRHGGALPLPAGGVTPLGRGAVLVGPPRAAGDKAEVGEDGRGSAALAAVQAALATLARSPSSSTFASVDAVLVPLADDADRPAAGAAAAARLYLRGLAVLESAGKRGGGGGGDSVGSASPAWPDASALRPPSLAAASAVTDAGTAACRLDRLADLLGAGLHGGAAGCGGTVAAFRAAAAALRAGAALPPTPPPPTPALDWVPVRGVLDAPGGLHARPLDGVAGLPLRMPLAGRVVAGAPKPTTPPRAWLAVSSPLAPARLLLPLHLEGEGVRRPPAKRARSAAATTVRHTWTLPPFIDLPAAPSAPDVTLSASLLVEAGVSGGRSIVVQVAPSRQVRVLAAPPADAHREQK